MSKKSKVIVVSAIAAETAKALRHLAEPRPVGDRVKAAIGRAARKAGLPYWRAFDLWYAKAHRIDAVELEKIRAAQRETAKGGARELYDLAKQIEALAQRLSAVDADFTEPHVDALRDLARRSRDMAAGERLMFYDGWKNKLALLWARLLGRVAVPVDLPPLPFVDETPVAPVIAPQKPKRKRAERDTHLQDILKSLPECRRLMRKLRKVDPDAYDYHSRMGAKISDNSQEAALHTLSDSFVQKMPARGMIYMDAEPDKDGSVYPSFCYFSKGVSWPNVLAPRVHSGLYQLIYLYFFKGEAAALTAHFAIVDGAAVLLRERLVEHVQCPRNTKRPGAKGRGRAQFSRVYAGFPRGIVFARRDVKKRGGFVGETVEEFASTLFHIAANFSVLGDEGFQVRAERAGTSVVFNVALGKTARFFRNRDITELAADGRRKRIFHYVESHERANGSVVKAHYRGLRRFTWEENKVVITKPENAFSSFSVPSYDADEFEDKADMMESKEVASYVRQALEAR